MINLIILLIAAIILDLLIFPDIILIFVLSEILIFTIYFTVAEFYFLFTVIVFLLYFGLKYNDGDDYTGARSWSWLRKFTFNQSIAYSFVDKSGCTDQEKILFVVVGNLTHFSLLSGFGFHGGQFGNTEIHYILPPVLFKIPIMRDILLWSGAVTYQGNDKEHTVLQLLKRNKSVAYSPSEDDNESPPIEVFEFALKYNILVVPVLIRGENERYNIRNNKLTAKSQRYCMAKIKWPFPFWFFVKLCDSKPPPKVKLFIGPVMNSKLYDTADKFSTAFIDQFEGLTTTTDFSKTPL